MYFDIYSATRRLPQDENVAIETWKRVHIRNSNRKMRIELVSRLQSSKRDTHTHTTRTAFNENLLDALVPWYCAYIDLETCCVYGRTRGGAVSLCFDVYSLHIYSMFSATYQLN